MDRNGPRIRANRKNQKALVSLLRKIREDAGLRQVDMAAALRVPQSFVSKYELGERRLDFLELREVCLAANVSLSEFAVRFEAAVGKPFPLNNPSVPE